MNKGFFVVFLAIVIGAMGLIFVNQASKPASGVGDAQLVAENRNNEANAPAVAQPLAGNGASTPAKTEPVKAQPDKTEPAKTQPGKTEPAKNEPAKPNPVKTEPAQSEPVKAAPDAGEPVKTEPAKTEPAKTEPAKTEPAKADPVVAAPAKTEPATQPQEQPAVRETAPPAEHFQDVKPRKSLTLRNIGLHFKGNGMVLRVEADGPFSYKAFVLPGPDRYVVDLVGTWANMRAPSVPSNMMVKKARVGKQGNGPRVVLDLQRAPKKHEVNRVAPNVLEIYIE